MKSLVIALCATVCLSATPTLAQAAPSEGDKAKNPMAEKMKELVQGCRKAARESGLKPQTPEMRQSVIECVGKERPGMAHVLKCRFEGMDKGLKPGDDLKAFVKECMKKSS